MEPLVCRPGSNSPSCSPGRCRAAPIEVAVVGDADRASALRLARPDRFVDETDAVDEVLVLGADAGGFGAWGRPRPDPGLNRLTVVQEGSEAGSDLEALHAAGLSLAGSQPLRWQSSSNGRPPAGPRAERLAAETRAVLLRCVLADDPRSVGELEQAVLRLQREVDSLSQLAVDHAATRETERIRGERLEKLERLAGKDAAELGDEVKRLQGELDRLQATRIWRMGRAGGGSGRASAAAPLPAREARRRGLRHASGGDQARAGARRSRALAALRAAGRRHRPAPDDARPGPRVLRDHARSGSRHPRGGPDARRT